MLKKISYVVAIIAVFMVPLLAQAGSTLLIVSCADPEDPKNYYVGYVSDVTLDPNFHDPSLMYGELVGPLSNKFEIEATVIDEATVEAFVVNNEMHEGKEFILDIIDIVELK